RGPAREHGAAVGGRRAQPPRGLLAAARGRAARGRPGRGGAVVRPLDRDPTGPALRLRGLRPRPAGPLVDQTAAVRGRRGRRRAGVLRRRAGTATVARRDHDGKSRGGLPAGELADQLAARALELAGQFDARNGTGCQTELLRTRLEAPPILDALPLTPPVVRWPVPAPRPVPDRPVPAGLGPDELL